jgi:hypothetical protein
MDRIRAEIQVRYHLIRKTIKGAFLPPSQPMGQLQPPPQLILPVQAPQSQSQPFIPLFSQLTTLEECKGYSGPRSRS